MPTTPLPDPVGNHSAPSPAVALPGPELPTDARALALARLAESRQRLGLQLLPPPAPTLCGAGAEAGPMAHRVRALWRYWRTRLHGSPLASVAMDAAQHWWQAQPWRGTAEMLGHELRVAATPAVRRHPLIAVGLVATLAAGLVLWRPWRSPLVAGHTQALGKRAQGWLLTQLRQVPLQALLGGLVALWASQRASTPAAPDTPPAKRDATASSAAADPPLGQSSGEAAPSSSASGRAWPTYQDAP